MDISDVTKNRSTRDYYFHQLCILDYGRQSEWPYETTTSKVYNAYIHLKEYLINHLGRVPFQYQYNEWINDNLHIDCPTNEKVLHTVDIIKAELGYDDNTNIENILESNFKKFYILSNGLVWKDQSIADRVHEACIHLRQHLVNMLDEDSFEHQYADFEKKMNKYVPGRGEIMSTLQNIEHGLGNDNLDTLLKANNELYFKQFFILSKGIKRLWSIKEVETQVETAYNQLKDFLFARLGKIEFEDGYNHWLAMNMDINDPDTGFIINTAKEIINNLGCYDKEMIEDMEDDDMPVEEKSNEKIIEVSSSDRNSNLYDKKFIITQEGDSVELYFKQKWDYEILDKVKNEHPLVLRIPTGNGVTKTVVLGSYHAYRLNQIVKNLIDFIYDSGDFVYQMPDIMKPIPYTIVKAIIYKKPSNVEKTTVPSESCTSKDEIPTMTCIEVATEVCEAETVEESSTKKR